MFISDFTAGYPKLIPPELVRRANGGERFTINLFAGVSTGKSVDGSPADAGLLDTRPLTPRQTAEQIIKRSAHPDYRPLLWDYYQRSVRKCGGHEPHLLDEAFFLHRRYLESGDMRVG